MFQNAELTHIFFFVVQDRRVLRLSSLWPAAATTSKRTCSWIGRELATSATTWAGTVAWQSSLSLILARPSHSSPATWALTVRAGPSCSFVQYKF